MMNLLLILIASSTLAMAMDMDIGNQSDMELATQEMQKANYFTFVMLLNMAPPDLFPGGNITFLMPTDQALSKTDMSKTSVADFLLLHSIPWPLLINHLMHFPTGSMIPTSRPGDMLRVTNDGQRHFLLNNVRVISPNVCSANNKGYSSIRCHGIDEVVQPITATVPNCLVNSSSSTPMEAPAPSPPLWVPAAPLPAPSPPAPVPTASPPAVNAPKSSTSRQMCSTVQLVLMIISMLSLVNLYGLSSL